MRTKKDKNGKDKERQERRRNNNTKNGKGQDNKRGPGMNKERFRNKKWFMDRTGKGRKKIKTKIKK